MQGTEAHRRHKALAQITHQGPHLGCSIPARAGILNPGTAFERLETHVIMHALQNNSMNIKG
jgi:hypothetical protein